MTTLPSDVLAGWVARPFTAAGATHPVYRKGSGPGVVLLPEAPGMTPEVVGLGERLVAAGFTVAVPSLFGTPGRAVSVPYAMGVMPRICVSREFAAFARRADRPVAEYVRALARELHGEVGGPGVGVIGMCFTGGFALAAAMEPAVLAPVASQPSVPFPLGSRKHDVGMSDRERDAVVARVRDEGLCALGLRFSEDRVASRERFDRLADLLGDGWRVIEIDSSPGNPHGIGRHEHSVLTSRDVGKPGHPVTAANDEVIAFLRERLTPA
jgi:dienelactone hydrolase